MGIQTIKMEENINILIKAICSEVSNPRLAKEPQRRKIDPWKVKGSVPAILLHTMHPGD